jgi:hypothetical protein
MHSWNSSTVSTFSASSFFGIFQHLGQRRQRAGLHVLDIDLDDVAQRREFLHVFRLPDHIIERKLEAGLLEFAMRASTSGVAFTVSGFRG